MHRPIWMGMVIGSRSVRRILLTGLMTCMLGANLAAQEPLEIALWPEGLPDTFRHDRSETVLNREEDRNDRGLNRSYSFVSVPTMAVYLPPEAIKKGTGVLIFPGGGHQRVVIDKEGHDVARWLVNNGIAAFVVKYRTIADSMRIRGSKVGRDEGWRRALLSDTHRALQLVHMHAADWGLDQKQIGMMGFSAGGYLVATLSASADILPAPAFQVLLYPALAGEQELLEPVRRVPMFLAVAADDRITPAGECLAMYGHMLEGKVISEIHVFPSGGHGFGLGVRGGAVSAWKHLCLEWINGRAWAR